MFSIKTRLENAISSWPPPTRKDFRRYFRRLHRVDKNPAKSRSGDGNLPYWLLLPQWLAAEYNKNRTKRTLDTRFINDILWAQYCLFLSIRIKDDLLDRQAESFSLLFVADQFLIEAYSVFSAYMKQATSFWNIFRNCLEETIRGIINVDILQQNPDSNPKRVLNGYAGVSSVFKIASAAVCHRAARMQDFPKVVALADALAKAGQILDDLQDIDEDLHRNRFNYVSIFILRCRKRTRSRKESVRNRVAENMIFTDCVNALFAEVYAQLQSAQTAMKELKIPGVREYFGEYREMLSNIKRSYHRKRMEIIFQGEASTFLKK